VVLCVGGSSPPRLNAGARQPFGRPANNFFFEFNKPYLMRGDIVVPARRPPASEAPCGC
jgi:hypothetical protein